MIIFSFVGAYEQAPAGQPSFPPYSTFAPNQQVQTFDYSHQRVPGLEQASGAPAPVTFDYEHGRAPLPDGAPPLHEDIRDPTIPLAPYYDLPAGLMVPLVKVRE